MLVYELDQQSISRSDEASLRAAYMVQEASYLQRFVRFAALITLCIGLSWIIS